ncbi:RNA polymerase sigma factor [Demequina globuliformis]|uniref:RNA polymerase sigma factor n=1 Tax=Demequina globuliformis TaxID=676202 RepID=UPI000784D297|nr:RNA polymerase sigma factor [Demequina globuliformis]
MTEVVRALDANSADLLAYLERRLGVHDAPDVLSEVMTVAWRRAADLPADPEQARMWLFGIAKGALANARRGEVRRANLADRLRAISFERANVSAPADTGLTTRECIDALPAQLAEVIRLVHWEGFSLAEIAQLEQVSPSTVRSRYARAKELLREMLDESIATVTPLRRAAVL